VIFREGLLGGLNAKVRGNADANDREKDREKDRDRDNDKDVHAAMQIGDGPGASPAGSRALMARSGWVRGCSPPKDGGYPTAMMLLLMAARKGRWLIDALMR
jgi:hypothetical protein